MRFFLTRRQREKELRQELQFHLEAEAEQRRADGMAPDEARRAAHRDLGNIALVTENTRDMWSWTALEQFVKDLRFAARTLRHNPGFTLTAVATLALGIGVNATVFTVTKAALFAGFPMVEGNDRILYLSSGRGCCASYPDFEDWRAQAKSFQGMAIVHGAGRTLSDKSGFTESYDVTEVSSGTFGLIGRRPMLGRDFTPADEVPGAPPALMLTYGFWERRFGKDAGIVGRQVRMNGAPATVIGIMPQGFSFPQKQEFWVPLIPTTEVQKRDARDAWFAFGRLADGVTIASARAEMETVGRRLGSAYPLTNQGRNLLPFVQTFNEFFFFGNENTIYWSMWGAVGFVLLIVCANLANLMLARAIGRTREISLRMALGAGWWRIVRQLLIESLMLSAVGGALGCWIARWGVHAWELADRGPGRSSWRILDYSMDYRVLAYLIAISIGTAFIFGLAPARRLSKLDVNAMLKDGGRGATGGSHGRHLSAILVVGEIALAVMLLAGAGVMIRSFLHLYSADLGVRTANILTMTVNLPKARYPGPEAQLSFYNRLKTQLEAIPGVQSVAITRALPTGRTARFLYEMAGAAAADEQNRPRAGALGVGADYFRTLGAAVRFGRDFNGFDGVSGVPAAIVNQQFAEQNWAGENPLGKRLRLYDQKGPGAWLTVIGVAPNIVQNDGSGQHFSPLVYLPYAQKPDPNMDVMAQTSVPPNTLMTAFRREVQKLDSELPIFGPLTLDERLEPRYWTQGLYGVLFLILAVIALLLASVGIYAVIAHSVNRRTQEIGIRIAVGGSSRDVLRLVFRQGMFPVAPGLMLGLLASLAVNPILKTFLVDVSPSDPITLIAAAASLLAAAALGCLIPARRATETDPAVALRHD